ncbi:MAG: gamma-glutamyltransferase [Planctomycetes bacterium]|nr:gamma-glutamyltransferase [Planctomycetota bacterium]
MDRRSFLKVVGVAGASSILGCSTDLEQSRSTALGPGRGVSLAGRGVGDAGNDRIAIDREMLRSRNQNRSTVICQNGIVCTSQPLASIAGVDILKGGGNAIDAAVCANAMLSVVEPMSCGPGGDLFAIVWIEKEKRLYGLNASGRAPYDWSLKEAAALGLKDIPTYGPLSWSVPGCVSGWAALLKKMGKLKFSRVLEAPIHYAREGFAVTPIIAGYWRSVNAERFPTLGRTFAPEGRVPRFGDVFKNPDMARFFEIIARGGEKAFYRGEIAERIVKFSKANGGRFEMRDFREHTADWIDPVSANYRGYDVWELPPNGQGIAALQILNMLENFDIGSLGPNSAEHLHLFIEAKKLAFEDRAIYYADMDFADVPLKRLISKEYAKERAKLIDPERAAQQVAPGRLSGPSDTIYLTAADGQGNMVSLIQSTYYGFGSQMVPDGLGFALQNRGRMFSLNPDDLNKLEPHKRPFHTIIPGFMTRGGRPVFSFGVMGGDFQPQGHSQVLMNIIDFGFSPQQAGEQPRVAHFESSTPMGSKMAGGGSVGFERHIPDDVKRKLADMGHKVRSGAGAFGGYQGIWAKSNPLRYFGGSDPRKDGCAIGY